MRVRKLLNRWMIVLVLIIAVLSLGSEENIKAEQETILDVNKEYIFSSLYDNGSSFRFIIPKAGRVRVVLSDCVNIDFEEHRWDLMYGDKILNHVWYSSQTFETAMLEWTTVPVAGEYCFEGYKSSTPPLF